MSNTDTFSSLYSLLKWFTLLLHGLLWCSLLLVLYRWIASRSSSKSSFPRIPGLRTPFYSFYGHIQTLPSKSVMKQMSLSLHASVLQTVNGHAAVFPKELLYQMVIVFKPFIFLQQPKSVEELLKNSVLLEKSEQYEMLHPWLGTGLLTSHGSKWKSRRKLLTHSFHFDILKEFLPVFDEQAKVLVGILKKKVDEEWINVVSPITLCSLDIICETTLGTQVGAQSNSQSEFVEAIGSDKTLSAGLKLQRSLLLRILRFHCISHDRFLIRISMNDSELQVIQSTFVKKQSEPVHVLQRSTKTAMHRLSNPILHPEIIFRLSKLGRQFKKDVNCLHNFTRKVIADKKEALRLKPSHLPGSQNQEFFDQGKRKRKALMDLLLDIHMTSDDFTEEDIREEIDTFAFEGHDTTSMGMSWALYLIGLYPDVQRKVHQELDEIYGDDGERSATLDDLREMEYLERVLKESQRLYPSVPFYGRKVPEDTNLCGYKLKKGSTIVINTFGLHRNPEVFPNPEKFDPDRFLPENSVGRSPFAYVPFSAGPRNCIGQRFAMMEEKTVISNVLRLFHIKSLEHRDKITPSAELTLRSELPLKLKFTLRKSSL